MLTLSLWDLTTGERLVERPLHRSHFPEADVWVERTRTNSTVGREGHRFEPCLLWEDFVDSYVNHVRLAQTISHPVEVLEAKALAFDRQLQAEFLDPIPGTKIPSPVVARQGRKTAERGDSAPMIEHYVATEALRLQAQPSDTEAQHNGPRDQLNPDRGRRPCASGRPTKGRGVAESPLAISTALSCSAALARVNNSTDLAARSGARSAAELGVILW